MSRRLAASAAAALIGLGGCASHPRPMAAQGAFQEIGFSTWREDEPGYRLYPGDQLDVAMPSAPELNRSITVQPDGRVTLPLIAPVMAAERTGPELEAELAQAYASQLRDPRVEVSVKAATPLRIFVGGEVSKPGVYDMPGDIDALQAVLMAGSFLPTGEPHRVVLIRRGPDGRPMMRYVDMGDAVLGAPHGTPVALRRFDIIYVPRSGIARVGLLVEQYLRDVVPVQFSYATGSNNYLTTR